MSGRGIQSFFSFISNHHTLIEDLFRKGMKSERVISEQDLINAVKSSDKISEENTQSMIARLVDYRIIQEFDESYYELTLSFNQFLNWLLKERILFDTGFLQASINRMNKSQTEIESNLDCEPHELQKSRITIGIEIRNILEAMDDLRSFSESNRSAIILETRSPSEDSTSLSKLERFIRIQRLYDEYVDPARKMVGDQFAEVCESVIRTLSKTEKQLFDSEDIIGIIRILRIKMVKLRNLVSTAHHDMWNELRTAMKEFRGYLNLYNASILAQKEILQGGAGVLSNAIESNLRMVSIRPGNLFTDIAAQSFLYDLQAFKEAPPQIEIPTMNDSDMPVAPINTRKLKTQLRRNNGADDLLLSILDMHPEKSLESCFLATIEVAEDKPKSVEIQNERPVYTRLGSKVKFSKIKLEAFD